MKVKRRPVASSKPDLTKCNSDQLQMRKFGQRIKARRVFFFTFFLEETLQESTEAVSKSFFSPITMHLASPLHKDRSRA